MTIVCETERLILRELTLDDALSASISARLAVWIIRFR